jgi:3-dehydroquinate synthetase
MGAFNCQAIETGTGYGAWLHGEAVAAGTVSLA